MGALDPPFDDMAKSRPGLSHGAVGGMTIGPLAG